MVRDRQANPEDADATPISTPPQTGEGQWIMNAINRLDDRVTQNAANQDSRLRSVENTVSSLKGWIAGLGVGFAVLQILLFLALRFLDISLK